GSDPPAHRILARCSLPGPPPYPEVDSSIQEPINEIKVSISQLWRNNSEGRRLEAERTSAKFISSGPGVLRPGLVHSVCAVPLAETARGFKHNLTPSKGQFSHSACPRALGTKAPQFTSFNWALAFVPAERDQLTSDDFQTEFSNIMKVTCLTGFNFDYPEYDDWSYFITPVAFCFSCASESSFSLCPLCAPLPLICKIGSNEEEKSTQGLQPSITFITI
ncbi:hypothetical protein PO909_014101, partial [Leuciscus waleckii]